jgi:ABC-type Fe3+ transport system permease subunit
MTITNPITIAFLSLTTLFIIFCLLTKYNKEGCTMQDKFLDEISVLNLALSGFFFGFGWCLLFILLVFTPATHLIPQIFAVLVLLLFVGYSMGIVIRRMRDYRNHTLTKEKGSDENG